MGTVQDLDAATLCFYLANIPRFLTNDFKPIMLKLKFGETTMKVNEFELQSYENFTARFDPALATEISNNSTNHLRFVGGNPKITTNRAAVFKTILPTPTYDPIEGIVEKSADHPFRPRNLDDNTPPPYTAGGNTGGADASPPKK